MNTALGQRLRWEHPTLHRYYQAYYQTDLWGTPVLVLSWGRIGSRQGQSKTLPFSTAEQAQEQLKQIHTRRLQHGYQLIQGHLSL